MENTYTRNGKVGQQNPQPGADTAEEGQGNGEKSYRVDGFGQVLEMLKIADDEFRASLLGRLESADPALAASLRTRLRELGML